MMALMMVIWAVSKLNSANRSFCCPENNVLKVRCGGVSPIPVASQPAPFESQFFHDDVDDGASFAGVEDALGLDMGGLDDNEDDLMAASQAQIKKIRPETVHYAKRAKRVDVKRLKDNIWKGLNIAIAAPELQSDSDVSDCIRLLPVSSNFRVHV